MSERPWPIESLPRLTFDQTLTLLGTEVQSLVGTHGSEAASRSSRLETVTKRLEELHAENLMKIEKASA